jgi:hypothetical protein
MPWRSRNITRCASDFGGSSFSGFIGAQMTLPGLSR